MKLHSEIEKRQYETFEKKVETITGLRDKMLSRIDKLLIEVYEEQKEKGETISVNLKYKLIDMYSAEITKYNRLIDEYNQSMAKLRIFNIRISNIMN